MLGQAPDADVETSLYIQAETGQAALSRDGASWRSFRFLWAGFGCAVFMVMGFSACALRPLASYTAAKPSPLHPSLAFAPHLSAIGPRDLAPATLPARVRAHPTSFGSARPAVLPRMSQQHSRVNPRGPITRMSMSEKSTPAVLPPRMSQQPTSRVNQRGPITRMSMSEKSTQGQGEDVASMISGPRMSLSQELTGGQDKDVTGMIKQQLKGEEAEQNRDAAVTDTSTSGSLVPHWVRVGAFAVLATLGLAQPAHAAHTYSATTVWLLESCIGIGAIKMGIQGLVSQFFFLSPLPVFRKIANDKSVGQLPLLPYSSMFVQGVLGCSYGALMGNPAIWLCNIPPVLLGGAYTAMFCTHCPKDADWLPGTTGIHLLGMLLSVCFVGGVLKLQDPLQATSTIGAAAVAIGVVMFSGPLSAIRTVIEEQSTRSLPFPMMVATVLNCSLWSFYGAELLHDPYVWLPNVLGLLSGLAQAALFWHFGFAKEAGQPATA